MGDQGMADPRWSIGAVCAGGRRLSSGLLKSLYASPLKRVAHKALLLVFFTAGTTLVATGALAQEATSAVGQDETPELAALAIELGKLAIVVVLVESAMASLFNWRVYRAVFNQRALKTPVMLAVGLLIVKLFNYDIFARAMVEVGALQLSQNVTDPDQVGNWLTQLISAMIIAGGSSGINTLFQTLGLRSVLPDEPTRPQLNATEAWISVLVNGAPPGDAFHIAIMPLSTASGPELAGSVEVKNFWQRVSEAFRSYSNRFPNYGGWSLTAGQNYRIEVIDTRVANAQPKVIFEGSFAPRAIIDFQVSVSKV